MPVGPNRQSSSSRLAPQPRNREQASAVKRASGIPVGGGKASNSDARTPRQMKLMKINKGAAGRPEPPQCQNDWENRASRNSPNFAVALNCGIGSSSLNADVNAFDRLQIVRDVNSSYFGSK